MKIYKSLLLCLSVIIIASCGTPQKLSVRAFPKHKKAVKYKKRHPRTKATPKEESYARQTKRYDAKAATRDAIITEAKKYIGTPYVFGGKSELSGFDCSGFTAHVFTKAGIPLKGPSYEQAKAGQRKSLNQAKKGDLLIFGKGRKVTHVAIVADVHGDSIRAIHSTSSRGVVIDEINHSQYWKSKFLYARDIVSN